jgi:hypothetical protein
MARCGLGLAFTPGDSDGRVDDHHWGLTLDGRVRVGDERCFSYAEGDDLMDSAISF